MERDLISPSFPRAVTPAQARLQGQAGVTTGARTEVDVPVLLPIDPGSGAETVPVPARGTLPSARDVTLPVGPSAVPVTARVAETANTTVVASPGSPPPGGSAQAAPSVMAPDTALRRPHGGVAVKATPATPSVGPIVRPALAEEAGSVMGVRIATSPSARKAAEGRGTGHGDEEARVREGVALRGPPPLDSVCS